MTTETKSALIDLCAKLEELGFAMLLTIGPENSARLRAAAHCARAALGKEPVDELPAKSERPRWGNDTPV